MRRELHILLLKFRFLSVFENVGRVYSKQNKPFNSTARFHIYVLIDNIYGDDDKGKNIRWGREATESRCHKRLNRNMCFLFAVYNDIVRNNFNCFASITCVS